MEHTALNSELQHQMMADANAAFKARAMGKNLIFGYLAMPGIGKSDMMGQVANALKAELWDNMVLSGRTPMDLQAHVPDVEEQLLRSFPSDCIPLKSLVGDRRIIWFLDEVTNMSQDTGKPLQEGIRTRWFGEHELGENVIIMLAGNRASDKAGSGQLTTAMYNRVTWRNVEWTAKHSDIAVAYVLNQYQDESPKRTDIAALLTGYFIHKPILEKDFTDALGKLGKEPFVQWCSPRSLEALVCRIACSDWQLPGIMDMAGDIGLGRATEVSKFASLVGKLEKFEKVLENPSEAKIPESIEAQYAMLANLAVRVKKDTLEKVWQYVFRYTEVTMRISFVMMALKHSREITQSPVYDAIYRNDRQLRTALRAA